MKERPIIFDCSLIPSIIDGIKTQTRRVMKVQPPEGWDGSSARSALSAKCPHGKTGDLLWVRETWQGQLCEDLDGDLDFFSIREFFVYKADGGPTPEFIDSDENYREGWNSPVSMPRAASRITLEVTDVRVERLQDISEEDAKAEGIRELPLQEGAPGSWWRYEAFASKHYRTAIDAFRGLWTNINKKPENSWESNPWVWVIDFKKLEK